MAVTGLMKCVFVVAISFVLLANAQEQQSNNDSIAPIYFDFNLTFVEPVGPGGGVDIYVKTVLKYLHRGVLGSNISTSIRHMTGHDGESAYENIGKDDTGSVVTFISEPNAYYFSVVNPHFNYGIIDELYISAFVPAAFSVGGKSGIKNWADFAKIKKITVGGNDRSIFHLIVKQLVHRYGLNIKFIPYSSIFAAMQDAIDGKITAALPALHTLEGNPSFNRKLQTIAISAPFRTPEFPDVPTFDELGIVLDGGVPTFQPGTYSGFAVSRRVDRDIKAKLVEAIHRVNSNPAFVTEIRQQTITPLFYFGDRVRSFQKEIACFTNNVLAYDSVNLAIGRPELDRCSRPRTFVESP